MVGTIVILFCTCINRGTKKLSNVSKVIEQANCRFRISKPGNLGPESILDYNIIQHLLEHYSLLYYHIQCVSQGSVGQGRERERERDSKQYTKE